jgi:hypothetical protein
VTGQSLDLNLSSTTTNSNAADSMIIGDIFNRLNIRSNGYSGINGKTASQICADTYKQGIDGFGTLAKNEFDQRRLFDLSMPQNSCVDIDVQYLQDNNFTCDEEGYQEIPNLDPSVLVQRLKGKNRCIGLSYHNVCLSRTVRVSCNWSVKYTDPPAVAGTFSTSSNDKETKILTIPELEYLNNVNKPGFKDYICENLTRLPSEPAPVELIKNGDFYIDLRNWDNIGSLWSEQRLKLTGGAGQVEKSIATQVIQTEPGSKYRFQATWSKATEHEYASSGNIKIYSDLLKNNLLHNENIFEFRAIGGVFLTSDQLPFHFGQVKIGTNSPLKSITIINKDDRPASNCSAPYLTGDISEFAIANDACQSLSLAVGESCSFDLRARPNSLGRKSVRVKRNCIDDFGNSTTQLNEEVAVHGYQEYFQQVVDNVAVGKYTDGFYWRYADHDSNGTFEWFRCSETYPTLNCFASTPYSPTLRSTEKGLWVRGYQPSVMNQTDNLVATIDSFPLVLNTQIPVANRLNSIVADFTFTATSPQAVIDLSTILKFNAGYFDKISVQKVSQNAGPTIKPPTSKTCPNTGCVAGQLGNGYYELQSVSYALTSPGFNSTYYNIPAGSDWMIVYVPVGATCPANFTLLKSSYLASNIGYDENDQECDDVSVPEDPTGTIIKWKYVGFDRQPEFGTELIQCRLGSCLVDSSIRDLNRNLRTLNPGSGTNGTQQGESILFIYDVNATPVLSAQNGSGGNVGVNDLPNKSEQRICAKIKDAATLGLDSSFAKSPVVDFRRYNWQALKVQESGNFGRNPPNNGKTIKLFKKIDSSVRYLLQKELF